MSFFDDMMEICNKAVDEARQEMGREKPETSDADAMMLDAMRAMSKRLDAALHCENWANVEDSAHVLIQLFEAFKRFGGCECGKNR